MNYINKTMQIRRELLYRLCQALFNDNQDNQLDKIPYIMRPKKSNSSRCCLYKDRAMLKSKLTAMLGVDPDLIDEPITLDEIYRTTKSAQPSNRALLSVVGEACSMCNKSNFVVTNQCRSCVARTCEAICPKGAITFEFNQAVINSELCINCGKCQQNCPYHAIIYQPIPCEEACPVGAIKEISGDKHTIDESLCINCGKCLNACPFGAVIEENQLPSLIHELRNNRQFTALVAPAIAGQFNCTIGQLKKGLELLGIANLAEVAKGADITIQNESHEVMEILDQPNKVMTTSCCPSYLELIKKHLKQHTDKISHTQTPLFYTAEIAKKIYPQHKLIFIGPCLAKKGEVAANDLIDYCITFEELGALFIAKNITPNQLIEDRTNKLPASKFAHGFAASGGVAAAVANALSPEQKSKLKFEVINGLDRKNVTKLKVALAKPTVNLVEVMACEGGCIGGPCTVVLPALAIRALNSIKDTSQK